MPTKVFFVVPVEPKTERVSLRRYRSSTEANARCPAMPGQYSYHNAHTPLGDLLVVPDAPAHDDPRWPTQCECGYQFIEEDSWQVFSRTLYTRLDGQPGGPWMLEDVPPGAMWSADWLPHKDYWRNPIDNLALMVKLPNGHDWHVDGECSNCTRKGDTSHKCWIRHGDPKTGNIHVDKNGNTCAAGAGSILSGNYHGFLRDGYLTDGM